MRNFVGRKPYLHLLETLWKQRKTKMLSVYGRRRVGKTALLQVFSKNKRAFLFEALEGEDTPTQVRHFLNQLSLFADQEYIHDLNYTTWPQAFDLLSTLLTKEKSVFLCFDELSWMAAGRAKLISYIKFYWDKYWKDHPHLVFVLCGSVASWMVRNVVRSKALYGRVSENILLPPLRLSEVGDFIGNKRGKRETLEYFLCFGGVPRYLEEFDFNQSFQINVERTCFRSAGFFVEEADKIFYNQFRETLLYQKIVANLLRAPLSLQELSKKLGKVSSGGLKLYLDNLKSAGILDTLPQIKNFQSTKRIFYCVTDEFLRFDSQYITPNRKEIELAVRPLSFSRLTQNKWYPFLGFAFERFCVKNRYLIATALGIENKIIDCGPVKNLGKNGIQYDLVFLRSDPVITLCEVKYLSHPVSTSVIKDVEGKIARTRFPSDITLEKVLISNQPPSSALDESGYFNQTINIYELFENLQRGG